MRIALVGYGMMGKAIEKISPYEVVARLSSKDEINQEALCGADVCIDFTHPGVVVENIERVIATGTPLVVGTTGWDHQFDAVRKRIESLGVGLIYSANFSIGLQIFRKIVAEAASLISDRYDVGIIESHHRHKVDSPSGTAIELKKIIEERLKQQKNPINIASFRCGSDPGRHSVIVDSPFDTIELKYQAKNRDIYAEGALKAAEWISKKKGFYRFEEVVFHHDF